MNEITRPQLDCMLRAAAAEIGRNKAYLSELDTIIGDGDHGVTIARAMESMVRILDEGSGVDSKTVLQRIGGSILSVQGGATGALFGSFFIGLSDGISEGSQIDPRTLAKMFRRAQEQVVKVSGASQGDKTLMDALVPAVTTITSIVDNGQEMDVIGILARAAEAADKGAEATTAMKARKGRARHMCEKSIGHKDPGATSMALLFRGLADGAKAQGAKEAQTGKRCSGLP